MIQRTLWFLVRLESSPAHLVIGSRRAGDASVALRRRQETLLDLARESATLVCIAINGIGDPFAVHGFASERPNDIHCYRFKDFN